MLRGEDDYQNYFEDTMRAGHYENNARAVDLMIRSSNSIIRDLVERKVDFTRDETGNLMFTREAAHSQPVSYTHLPPFVVRLDFWVLLAVCSLKFQRQHSRQTY